MNTSLEWLNAYLDRPVSAQEAEHVLTDAGFPIEETRDLPGGDTFLDVEITSNRGDCLSHVGLAREIAACTDRKLRPPPTDRVKTESSIEDHLTLVNDTPDVCPLFTARLIRGVKVGPSPDWMVRRLEAVGQRSINNIVDVTNYITFELGNPCHVFDLARLADATLRIRWAGDGEKLTTLDGKQRVLKKTDLVVADGQRAQSLAGVIGGADSEVGTQSTDVVFEMATWDPATIRRPARRLAVRTDASHRFERIVDPRTINDAARRAVALLMKVAGGQLVNGALEEGRPLPEPTVIDLRPSRCNAILGIDVPVARMIHLLRDLEVEVEQEDGDTLRCTTPPHRPDLLREIDLVEEVARTHGLDNIPVYDRVEVLVQPPQERERARRELNRVLTGLGFFETVTFSFVSPGAAAPFMPPGLTMVRVDDARRKAEPVLRPSPIPSLLTSRRANDAGGVHREGGLRLYELSAVFAEDDEGNSVENRNVALLVDVPGVARGKRASPSQIQHGLRLLRGALGSIVRNLVGPDAVLDIEPAEPVVAAFVPGSHAVATVNGRMWGIMGLLSDDVRRQADLALPVVAAEVNADLVLDAFPPQPRAHSLPAFPPIERDLSLIVAEATPWAQIEQTIHDAGLERFETCEFVGAYRGKQVGSGRKSVTARLRFRDPSRTLRSEEVDEQIQRLVSDLRTSVQAELRA